MTRCEQFVRRSGEQPAQRRTPRSSGAAASVLTLLIGAASALAPAQADEAGEVDSANVDSADVDSVALKSAAAKSTAVARTDNGDSLDVQRQRLEQMSPEDRESLRRRSERFYHLPEPERQRLRDLHQQLDSHPEGQRLREVMQSYTEWLRTISSGERAELLSLPADERLARIKELKQQQETQRFRGFVDRQLTRDDLGKIYAWLDEVVKRNEPQLMAQLSEERREFILEEQDEQRRRRRLMFAVWSRRGPDETGASPLDPITPEDIPELIASLSAEAKTALAEARGLEEKRALLQRWSRAAMFARQAPNVDDKTLMEFFDKLASEHRQRLEGLPRDEMLRDLERWYVDARFRGVDASNYRPSWGGGPGRGGRGPGGLGPGGPDGPGGRGGPDGPGGRSGDGFGGPRGGGSPFREDGAPFRGDGTSFRGDGTGAERPEPDGNN
jgi:hypothetical protein